MWSVCRRGQLLMSRIEGEARRERERLMGIWSGRMAIFYTPLGLPSDRRDSLNCQPPCEHRRSMDSEEHAGIHVDTHHGLVCQAHINQDTSQHSKRNLPGGPAVDRYWSLNSRITNPSQAWAGRPDQIQNGMCFRGRKHTTDRSNLRFV